VLHAGRPEVERIVPVVARVIDSPPPAPAFTSRRKPR
jgi:hypothetical protein